MRLPAAWPAVLALAGCSAPRASEAAPELLARASDGVPIAYEVAGQGEPALVFVHGWCGERALWRSTMARFAPSHRVVALDLAGHGGSGAERERWTLEALAGDVVAVVEALDLPAVILVGHSMGGPVALLAAPRLGGRVRAVIAVESLHDADFAYPAGYLAQAVDALEADFPRALEARVRGVLAPATEPELADWILARAQRTDRRAALGILRALEGFELAPALRAAGVPVRVINAAPRAGGLATDVEGNARHADFAAEVLEGAGHFPMLEQPEAFRAALQRWLDRLGPPSGES